MDVLGQITKAAPGLRHGRLVDYYGRGRIAVLRFRDGTGRSDIAVGDRHRVLNLVRMLVGPDGPALNRHYLYATDASNELVSLDLAEAEGAML